MTVTPWGDSGTLRERRLPPGPGASRSEVDRNQRERLFAATVAVTTDKGYANTSVADLTEVAGVSSSSFYRHFSDKEECFLATLAELLAGAKAVVAGRLERQGPWEERVRQAADAIVSLIVSQPAAARLCLVESYAAGPAAVGAVDDSVEVGLRELRHSLGKTDRPPVPREMAQAVAGGFRKIVHTRLHRGTERELLERTPELVELALSYEPPPAPLRRPRRTSTSPEEPSAVDRQADPGERIVRATMAVVATKGYAAVTMADIAQAAGVSLSTLYTHFDGKAGAFEAALFGGRARFLGSTLPAYRRGREWPEKLGSTIRATLAFLEGEPEFTRLITVDVYTAGAEALEGRDRAIETSQKLIEDGVEKYAPEMKPVWCEAIINILYVIVCEQVRKQGTGDLQSLAPLATYMALSPFVGAQEACEMANGRRAQERVPPM